MFGKTSLLVLLLAFALCGEKNREHIQMGKKYRRGEHSKKGSMLGFALLR